MLGYFNLPVTLNCDGLKEGKLFQPGLFGELFIVVPVWYISSCTLKSREILNQDGADKRAGEMQTQRVNGVFLCHKPERLLFIGRLGNAVEKGKLYPLKCTREGFCACPRLTVLSSALSVQKVLLFMGIVFPTLSSAQECNKYERLHQGDWFCGIRKVAL